MPAEGQNIVDHITEKYGSTAEQSQANRERIRDMGASLGFAFRTDGQSRIYNTFDAHRLLHWAGLEGREGMRPLATQRSESGLLAGVQ